MFAVTTPLWRRSSLSSLCSICLFSSLICSIQLIQADQLSVRESGSFAAVPVWQRNEGGYHTYRIPSIIRTNAGDLLAFCEGRKDGRGDAGNIDLVMKRSVDDGKSWSEQVVLWDDGPNTCGNPCPVLDESTGVIWLLLTHNLGSDHEGDIIKRKAESTRTVWVMSSPDEGNTWSAPREITVTTKNAAWGWYATGPGNGIQLQHGKYEGRLVIPCDHSYDDPNGKVRGGPWGFGSHVVYSDDHGASWKLGGVIRPNSNECQVVELADNKGSLLMNCRSYFGRSRRTQSLSEDGGTSWTPPQDVDALVEPVCQASIIRHSWPTAQSSGLLLFSNPADAAQRVRMTVKSSGDDGKSWKTVLVLHEGPAAYSSLVRLSDDSAGCLYEAGTMSAYDGIFFQPFAVTP